MDVMTVTGPVPASSLGFVLPHEHLLIDLTRAKARWDLEGLLDEPAIAATELAAFGVLGGRTLVEMTTDDLGRDPAGLRSVSTASGVNVVMGTGWYREPYYPESIDQLSANRLADHIIAEIDHGVGDTGIRPGVIGEIGCDRRWLSAREERVLRAAARAQAGRGLGLMTHTPPGVAQQQLEVLREEGADFGRWPSAMPTAGSTSTITSPSRGAEPSCHSTWSASASTQTSDVPRTLRS